MSREGCGEAKGVRRNWGDNCVVKTKRIFLQMVMGISAAKKSSNERLEKYEII